MSKLPDFDMYAELRVTSEASDDEIKQAYDWLARRFHPKRSSKNDAARFRRVATAYKVLSNPEERAHYDRTHKQLAARTKSHRDLIDSISTRLRDDPNLIAAEWQTITNLARALGLDADQVMIEIRAIAGKKRPRRKSKESAKPPFITTPENRREALLIGGQFIKRAEARNHTLNELDLDFLGAIAHALDMTFDEYTTQAKAVAENAGNQSPS